MLIDINSYIGHWPFRQLKHNTFETKLQLMKRFGIDVAVISNLNGVFYKNTQSANEELYEELGSNPKFKNRFVPFAVINPIYAGWRDDLKICVEKMGMKGVRLHPLYHRYSLTDANCVELVKRTRDLNLPIAFSLRIVDRRVSSWMDINEEWALKDILPIIKEVPDAKYMFLNVVNNLQNTIQGNGEEKGILEKTNFLIDTSGRAMSDLPHLIKGYGKEKFAYGSNSPILESFTGLLRIESLRPQEANKSAKELLRYGNAKKFLNL